MLVLFFSLVVSGNGFLLDAFQNKSGQAISNGQYLTVAEFYGEKNIQHQDMEHLRQDMDKKLVLLANQLQQQLATLSVEAVRNETKRDMMLLVQKYTTLEQDYNKLQTSHSQLQNAHTTLQGQFNILSNKSLVVDYELSALKQLSNIKPIQDISALQQNVQTLKTQTHTLNMKEQARSQDFLALFNMTMESRKALSEFDMTLTAKFHNQTVAMSNMDNRINNRLTDYEKHGNLSLMQDQINKNAEKVALMAVNQQNVLINGVMKFDSVNFNVGFNNVSTFIDTGKLVIEKSGLYLISVSVISNTRDGDFYIYLNGHAQSRTRISSGSWETGTNVIVLQLDKDEKIWVQTGQIQVSGG